MNGDEREPVIADIWLAANEDGGYQVGIDEEEAGSRLDECEGGYQRRMVKISVDITAILPAPIEVEAAIPEREDGSYELTITAA